MCLCVCVSAVAFSSMYEHVHAMFMQTCTLWGFLDFVHLCKCVKCSSAQIYVFPFPIVMKRAASIFIKSLCSLKDWATWFAFVGKDGTGLENTTIVVIRGMGPRQFRSTKMLEHGSLSGIHKLYLQFDINDDFDDFSIPKLKSFLDVAMFFCSSQSVCWIFPPNWQVPRRSLRWSLIWIFGLCRSWASNI